MKQFRRIGIFEQPPSLPKEVVPYVQSLLDIITQLQEQVQLQAESIQMLRDEIAVLKGQKGRPIIKPSRMDQKTEKDDSPDKKSRSKRLDSGEPAKTAKLEIHDSRKVKAVDVPAESRFLGYREFTVQDLKISPFNTRYFLERWETPDGHVLQAEPPVELAGLHFGTDLRAFLLYQHHHCHVTQPKLHEQLLEWGIDISAGQINALLTFGHDTFTAEKSSLLKSGLAVSTAITVDDSGARHQGKNGYVTVVSGPSFAWFGSADNKSRIGFLTHLHDGHPSYEVTDFALSHMRACGLKTAVINLFREHSRDEGEEWSAYLLRLSVTSQRHCRIVTEAALLDSLMKKGINPDLAIVSDGAGQFIMLEHGLCWVHTERLIHKLIPSNEEQRAAQENMRSEVWNYYRDLKSYQATPTPEAAGLLNNRFDVLFKQKTGWITLDRLLERIRMKKRDLLLVLRRPDVPLHTNASETDIRDYVKVRKISGGTRSDIGRECRDTFASLKKTCRKLGISFWGYLKDRIALTNQIPALDNIICLRAAVAKA